MADSLANAELESLALRAVDRALSGHPLEDSRFEAKATWPPAAKAARQLAGHANAARGEPIVWIIGLNERNKTVVNSEVVELANWWPSVESSFDGVAPTLRQNLVVPTQGGSVVALLFETSRTPYVTRTCSGTFEVPWREGNRTRTASRVELLRLLVALTRAPEVEVLGGELLVKTKDVNRTVRNYWSASLDLYITPQDEKLIVIPLHKCWIQLDLSPTLHLRFDQLSFSPTSRVMVHREAGVQTINLSETITTTHTELLIRGPGFARLMAKHDQEAWNLSSRMKPKLEGEVSFSPGDTRASLSVSSFKGVEAPAGSWKWTIQL